ncbi:MAG: hypothetical protein K2X39_01605 [Silvanigrellaceae bacterium]|nr:hypothetical protein [Silvanigrellaceae bacterium]
MSIKSKLKNAATAGIALGAIALQSQIVDAAPSKNVTTKCFGINKCKGQNGCGVDAKTIKAVNEYFKDKYKNSQTFECAGNSSCDAKKGNLAWVSKPSDADCYAAGGFTIEEKDGKIVIKQK